ncbi:kinase-like domain-containing protein [Mycena metata]|uniref:Kinase-like domain-containing protein n=1 Tax=Mycena metata TaxID=1033252 RepID=A0AAD7NM78_9AGAR|nr:kinase-like domain-containing protein [Mycena metata]
MWFPLHNDVWAKWFPSRHCHICGVSEFLYIWLETLQAVYSREDLLSIPWDYNCDCLAICLAVMHPKAHIPLGGDSPIVHALYKIVVTPWPLILWMAFRASNGVDVPTFLNTLRDQSCEDIIQLQNWDDEDSSLDVLLVGAESQTRIYPQEWMQYALEIDLRSWMEIRNTTRTTHHRGFHPDIQICIAAACVIFSSPPGTRAFSQTVLNHLRIPNFPFNTITLVIDKDYKPSSNPPLFASKEFWTRPRLESWIATRRLDFCNVVWQTNNLSNLERLEFISQALTAPCLLQRLNIYTCSLMIQLDAARDSFRNITNGFADRIQDNGIPPFGSYASKFEAILAVLKMVAKNHSSNHRAISIDVHKVMSNDICDIMAQLVFILQGAESRKRFLESRNTEAQELLNFLQDLLDLDTFSAVRPLLCKTLIQLSQASGLHPHCFPLTAVQKVGNQVAAGGFADIWKGLVQGQSVSLKIVRIFGDSDIQAALDEFGREALVWRQLCHPNVLPFFGLYYLDERLSLVSPWMERGNVIQFLKNKQTNVNRVSLMLDVALGLQYLHEQNVIHGDLKAINILVTPSGRACICDFGLSSIVNEISLRITRSTSTAQKGTPRYYAPELLGPKGKKHFASDTFAFACVCYEILTEKVPFYEIKNEMVVMLEVLKGIRPTRTAPCMGTAQLDSLWGLLQGCWEEKPKIRPTASQIVEHFVRPLLPTATQIEHLLFAEDSAGELHRE